MKDYLFAGVITFLPIVLNSCITSLIPLATYQNIVTDEKMVGQWSGFKEEIQIEKLIDSRYSQIFKEARKENAPFSEKDSIFILKHYVITFQEEKLSYIWVAAIVKIGKQVYVSLSPDVCLAVNDEEVYPNGRKVEKTHSFAKLEWNTNNTFKLHFLDGDYIKKIVLSGKARIKHEYDPLFGTFVITASPEELEQFLEKYGNDERLFKTGNSITLVRKTR